MIKLNNEIEESGLNEHMFVYSQDYLELKVIR